MSDERKAARRRLLMLVWLLIPVAFVYFHYGPGQALLAYDKAARLVKSAERLEAKANNDFSVESWRRVSEEYQKAYELIPPENVHLAQRIGLSVANAKMYQGELYEAMQQLDKLMEEAVKTEAPTEFRDQVRETLARSQFGAAWVMRLEGAESRDWLAQAEKARQNFRVLAEDSLAQKQAVELQKQAAGRQKPVANSVDVQKPAGNPISKPLTAIDPVIHQKNLEATIRMEHLDASVLKGLPLPKEARNCNGKGLSDKLGKGKGKEGKGKGDGKEGKGKGIGKTKEGDVRQKGAGEGERPQLIGS
jgi:tetratricopeptide (TPR) repeat protein